MKLQTWLRRTSASGTGYSLVLRDTLVKAAARIDDLERELKRHRRGHDVICAGEHTCTCGANDFNQSIDTLLAGAEMDTQKEKQ